MDILFTSNCLLKSISVVDDNGRYLQMVPSYIYNQLLTTKLLLVLEA